MNRSRLSATLAVLILLELSLAVLPHGHHEEAVRVGELHLGNGGEGACLAAAIELLPPAPCLACAIHLPPAATPTEPTPFLGLRDLEAAQSAVEAPRRGASAAEQRSRAPPALAA